MSTISANTFLAADGTTTTEPSIPALDQRMAKAWVNYDQVTNAVRSSYNVSSVTDNSTGNFTPNPSVTLSDDNLAQITCSYTQSIGGTIVGSSYYFENGANKYLVRTTRNDNNAYADVDRTVVIYFDN
jgi:hypothetical protein